MNNTQRLHALGQSLWLDNISRQILDDGTLRHYIDDFSVTGLTSNPTIFDETIGTGDLYDHDIRAKARTGKSGEALFTELALEDLRRAADLFRPIFDATDSIDGWVSMELSPLLADDTDGSIAAAQQIYRQADRTNLFVKIPGTPAGIPAIEESIFEGVPVNITLLFSREQYLAAAEAYMRGIERRVAAGLHARVGSVASVFVSRWDRAISDNAAVSRAGMLNQLGIAVAGRTYRAYRELLASPRWKQLATAGARPQRLLWGSTGTKDPQMSKTFYVEALAAPDTINTMPEKTLRAYAEQGQPSVGMADNGGDAESLLQRFAQAGVDVDAMSTRLQNEGAQAFVKSWQALMQRIADKSEVLAGAARSA